MALSTSEAEYMALAATVQEAKYLQQILQDMKIEVRERVPTRQIGRAHV